MKERTMLVADDHQLVVEGLTKLFQLKGFEVFSAPSAREALGLALRHQPIIIILDMLLADGNAEELVREIRFRLPEVRLLAYSKMRDKASVLRMADAGVQGFVRKAESEAELLHAVQALLSGQVYFNPEARSFLVNRILESDAEQVQYFGQVSLSAPELRIIRLTVQELPAREIGEKLFLSDRTIEQQRQRIMRKIGVKSIVGLVKFAVRHGIVDVREL